MRRSLALLFALVTSGASVGCDRFDPPPSVAIAGLSDGVLADPAQPITLVFSEPFDTSTLRVKLAVYTVDAEGNLPDEDADDATALEVLMAHEPSGDTGGKVTIAPDRRLVVLDPEEDLPIGPSLVVLIEPGLADDAGNATLVRRALKFAYTFSCEPPAEGEPAPVVSMPSGPYFFLVEVDQPVETQIQLYAWLDVDGKSGRLVGAFANADRPGPDGCPVSCEPTQACATLPKPSCVTPSTKAGSVDEFVDWIPNVTPPKGWTFDVTGCTRDTPGGRIALAIDPVDAVTQSPPVTSLGITMSGLLAPDDDGVLRGTGTFSVREVILGKTPSGPGEGSLAIRKLSEAEAPPGIPKP